MNRRPYVRGALAVLTALMLTGCGGGGGGDSIFLPTFAPVTPLTAAEVDLIIERAAASIEADRMTIAVTDRFGRILGLWSRENPLDEDNVNLAVSLARTASFMSSSQGPLSSRTLEFISTFHFPATFGAPTRQPVPTANLLLDGTLASQRATAGVAGTPQGPLWQIFSSNRGAPYAEPHLTEEGAPTNPPTNFVNAAQQVPPPRRIDVTGTEILGVSSPGPTYLPGGIPLFKSDPTVQPGDFDVIPRCVGGIGVYIEDALGEPQFAAMEFAAASGALGAGAFSQELSAQNPDPSFFFPAQPEGAIFLVGVLLPYTAPIVRPNGFVAGTVTPSSGGTTIIPSQPGGDQPEGFVIGPRADPLGNLTLADVQQIVNQSIATADGTRAAIRLPLGTATKMWIAVTNLEGLILAVFRMPDAPVFSYDVSITKARCVTYYSSAPGQVPDIQPADVALLNAAGIPTGVPGSPGENGVALTTRTLAFLTQPFFPPGIDTSNTTPGPLFPLAAQNADPATYMSMGSALAAPGLQSGIIFFPGSAPLYKDVDGDGNRELVGGIGISGDGVEQDDFVTAGGVQGFEPPPQIRVDNFFFEGVRLPYFKFPQLPGPGGG